jgi:hypothetical protein
MMFVEAFSLPRAEVYDGAQTLPVPRLASPSWRAQLSNQNGKSNKNGMSNKNSRLRARGVMPKGQQPALFLPVNFPQRFGTPFSDG